MIRALVWAILAMVVLVVIVAVTPASSALAALPYLPLLSMVPAGVLALDARRLRVREYQTSLGYAPWVLFVLTALWAIVLVPWYLTVRERIIRGEVPRRPQAL